MPCLLSSALPWDTRRQGTNCDFQGELRDFEKFNADHSSTGSTTSMSVVSMNPDHQSEAAAADLKSDIDSLSCSLSSNTFERKRTQSPEYTPSRSSSRAEDISLTSSQKHTELDSPQFDEELESLPSLSSWSSKPSSYQSWVPYTIPDFPDDATIEEWTIIGEGAHGQVRRVRARRDGKEAIVCVKLFSEEWRDAYERERDAYALLVHRGVKRCIPQIYYKREWPRWKWEGNQPAFADYELLYGLVMEHFDDCEQINMRKADIHMAEMLGRTLEMIHNAGVVHRDIEERNILLVREGGTVRIVWIDFSCAWAGKVYRGTGPIEWDMFRGFLLDTMDPRILTSDVLEEKFPRRPRKQTPDIMGEPEVDDTHETTLSSGGRLSAEDYFPLYLRLAFATFSFAHMIPILRTLLYFRFLVSHPRSTLEAIASASLGFVFLIARRQSPVTDVARSLISIFLIHNLISLVTAVYREMRRTSNTNDDTKLFNIAIVWDICWVVCGVLAVRKNS